MRRLLTAVMLGACGAAHVDHVDTPRVEPLPLPRVVAIVDSGSNAPVSGCLAPYDGGKPVDPAKLHDVETSAATAAEKGFARGRIYFEAEQWVSSAIAFRAVAFSSPDDDVGMYASQLYLESLNLLGTHGRADCYDNMANDVPLLHDLYCEARRAKNVEQCNILELIIVDIARLHAQKLVTVADRNPDPDAYRRGAEAYLALVRTKCMPQTVVEMRCDELAFNAATAFFAAGDDAAAKRVRAIMADPKNGMSASALTKKLSCRIDGPQSIACH